MADETKAYRRYPGASLEDSIDAIELVIKNLGLGTHTIDELANALSLSPNGGATKRKIAAMAAFSLLHRNSRGYEVTKLARTIVRPLPDELPGLLKQSFEGVPLYQEVLAEYKETSRFPAHLGRVFERKFGISDGNGELAAKIFLESAKYAGIASEDGYILDVVEEKALAASPIHNQATIQEVADVFRLKSEEVSHLKPATLTITLAAPASELHVPAKLSARDVAKITKWLEAAVKPWLGLQIEDLDEEADA